jgi:hypothetical protein
MRAKQFVPIVEAQQELFEVNMSPGNLKKLASGIDALVGIEFEMIVPDVGAVDDDYDYEQEEDMDYDERVNDIDDIVRFFNDGDYNDRSTIRELREELQEKFYEWQTSKISSEWNTSDGREFFAKWVRENVDPDDVADHVDKPEDLFGNREPDKEDWEKFIEDEWEDEGTNYDSAFDEFRDDKIDDGDFDEQAFLSDIGIDYMSEVSRNVRTDFMWPHWTSPEGSGDAEYNLEQLADEFSEVIGRRVDFSTGYHSGPRTSDGYTIEPDSSVSGSDDDAGLEFISPPLPIDEAIADVKKIKEWADEKGAYTNRSTGLHMNVSVPGFDPEKLDFVKLTLLLGDKFILDRFGRSANTYTRSAMEIIEEAPSTQDKELLFKKLKNNLEAIASRVIHSGRVGKFTSINPKENRVEFRGPGGDWLGQNFDKIEDTLYRCVVALEAAVDPEKYRKEYLKKLTKMFAPTKGSIEDVFVQYAAGTITREELKFKIKATQSQRKQQKFIDQGIVEFQYFGQAREGSWIVEYEDPNQFRVHRIILARTEQIDSDQKALEAAIKIEPSWFKPDEIENITVTEMKGPQDYVVQGPDGNTIETAYAYTPLNAIEFVLANNPELVSQRDSLVVKTQEEIDRQQSYQTSSGGTARLAPGEQLYTLINNTLDQTITIAAIDSATALSRALRNNPSWDSYQHQIRVLSATPTSEPEYQLYRVRGNGNSEYVSARSVSEAGRIALTAYPQLGDSSSDLDIVLQDSVPNVVNMYRRAQESEIERRNNIPTRQASVQATMGQPAPAFTNPNEGMERYLVNDAGVGGGGVVIRANSPEHAIERAREAYSISPDQELTARLYV